MSGLPGCKVEIAGGGDLARSEALDQPCLNPKSPKDPIDTYLGLFILLVM